MSYQLSTAITCISYFHIKAGYRDKLVKELLKLAELTRAEPACLQNELILDNDNPNFLILIQKFTSKQSLDEHEEQPYIVHFLKEHMMQYCDKVTWNECRELK